MQYMKLLQQLDSNTGCFVQYLPEKNNDIAEMKIRPNVDQMHRVWNSLQIANRKPSQPVNVNFDEIVSSVFSTGLLYYYVIDFFDMSVHGLSSGFKEAHGMSSAQIKHIDDILALIHPDDMDFVSKAENKALNYIYEVLGPDKFLQYKCSYNFRFKTPDGSYRLYNHQSLILTLDENNNFIKSLNIHTDISHITSHNNYKLSLIGLMGEPSFLNIDVMGQDNTQRDEKAFSKRELEIIRLIAEGRSSKEIAQKLHISIDTVKTHRKRILEKTNCANAAELIAISVSKGWV
jgi:DNA-binding CsgD family transcriptional regulator